MWLSDLPEERDCRVGLRSWHVAYAERVRNRHLAVREPFTTVLVVLSCDLTGAPVPEFARRAETACRDVDHRPRTIS
ncbi:MAG: hypothetical protein HY614_07080 [Candidatus Rokubacteria bacterium]|nr:hypothetical protein [Candidatus Rokubacteria bacterium]